MDGVSKKRSRSKSPPPWRRQAKSPRYHVDETRNPYDRGRHGQRPRNGQSKGSLYPREYARRNQTQENAQMQAWVSKEDEFVLKQSKKKAKIRARDGRAKPIDWLAVALTVVDEEQDLLDDDMEEAEFDVIDPEVVVDDVAPADLKDLEGEIDHYLILENDDQSFAYWKSLKTICQHRRQLLNPSQAPGRGMNSVSEDVDQLLGPKTLEQLRVLEHQVHEKLQSNEPIDEEYWEQLLDNIKLYKAKAHLKEFYSGVVEGRLRKFKRQQIEEAHGLVKDFQSKEDGATSASETIERYTGDFDPETMLKLSVEDKNKNLDLLDESALINNIASARAKIQQIRYVPKRQKDDKQLAAHTLKPTEKESLSAARFGASTTEDFSHATNTLYNREVARGVDEDEEIFAGEEEVATASKSQWASKYRPRKPRYFNRVQMGYEWNKYNQTHYDHDNPPPKVVQGYKFNVFYPDLIDKTRAPTYRIERENGRKKGQSFAPAGEDDTCLIRFMSGPPYEDLAFRIVDKEWDYSAKRERGFRSSFDKVSYNVIAPTFCA